LKPRLHKISDTPRISGEQQFSTVSLIAEGVNQELGDRLNALKLVATHINPSMLGSNTTVLQSFLEQRPVLLDMFNAGTFVTDIDGMAIASVPLSAQRIGINFMDRDHIAAALKEGKSTVSRPVIGRTVRIPIVAMVVPIHDAQGKVIGALAGVTDLSKPNFLDKISQGHYGKSGGYVLIIPRYRLIVTATDKSRIMTAIPALGINPALDRFIQGYEGSAVYTNPLGVEVLGSAKQIPVADWLMGVNLPTAEAFSPIRDMMHRIWLATIFLTLLAGGLTWWVISRLLKSQFSSMLAATKTLASLSDTHQPLQTLPITSQDEIGELIGGFNRLLEILKQREQALMESEERYRHFVADLPLGIVITQDGMIKYVNRATAEMIGYAEDELLNSSFFPLIDEADRRWVMDLHRSPAKGEKNESSYVLSMVRKDGEVRQWQGFANIIKWGDMPSSVGTFIDITERKKAEKSIAFLNRVYALLSGINSLIVRVHDRDELFREACRIAVETGGFRMSLIAILDKNTMKLVPLASAGKDDELMTEIKDLMSTTVDTAKTMVARAIREKQAVVSNDSQNDPRVLLGKKYAESGIRSMVILPLIVADEAVGVLALYAGEIEFFHDEEMQLLTELAGDIAFAIDHIDKQERLNYLAYYDVLTGLANRSLFHERVAQYMRSAVSGGYKLAIGLIDLERFKSINDSLGRAAGDALLKQVAEWLTQKMGDVNLLARIDADHFALVMPEVTQEGDLARLVEKTMEAFLQHPFYLNDAVFRIGVKVGIALFPDDGADTDTLFMNAEAALKKAKESGERYLFHTQKMTQAVAGKLTLENQLRQALDNEEFVLYYQPKINIVSGKVTSAEALIRWNDPRSGLVPPDRFIPILEETGLIYEVGRWAMRKAIQDYLRWRAAGLAAVRIAVNVSPLQLRNRNFIAEVEQKIGIDAHAAAGLELEITESLIMADVKHSIASLQAIRAMGITVAIDDFGTGFSSLSYLAKLPADTLKIDRSFVVDMTAGPEGLALVSTIISLAHSLNLKVVAEGVETEEQSRLLRLLNCDEIQGYFFSKPVPSEIFETRFLTLPPLGDR
jgi:diguanylate cyclase (GGDEF)-like protein/PAS domain S-box-containing protein